MEDTSSLVSDLESGDDEIVRRTLASLCDEPDGVDMEDRECQAVCTECVQLLSSPSVSVRAAAMAALSRLTQRSTTWIASGKLNEALITQIQKPDNSNLQCDDDKDLILHNTSLCHLIYNLQNIIPRKVAQAFKALGPYIIECTAHEECSIAAAGCEYWAKLQLPPMGPREMDLWLPPIMTRLQKLVHALLRNMMYAEEQVSHLESGESADEAPSEIEQYSNRRNYAALGFENLCYIFQNEITQIFKAQLLKRLSSENWLEIEGVLLALSAFTQALGVPRDMASIHIKLVHMLLEFYSHPKPLIRAMTCFTMQHFVNRPAKGMKDPFIKMLRLNTALLTDSCKEVRIMAARSLAAMLAHDQRDIVPFVAKIIHTLTTASTLVEGDTRYPYYECVGHFLARLGPVLDTKEMETLLDPILKHWDDLIIDVHRGSPEEIVQLCQPLCILTIYSKDSFKPYNGKLLDKIGGFLGSVVQNGVGKQGGEPLSTMLVAILDLTSALYEGQGKGFAEEAGKYQFAGNCLKLLQLTSVDEKVHQSAMAVVGHLCQNSYEQVQPMLSSVLNVIKRIVQNKDADSSLKNNALWTLGIIAKLEMTQNDQIVALMGNLAELVRSTTGDSGCVVHSAVAITSYCAKWPDQTIILFLKEGLVQYLSSLIQSQFPQDQERDIIFKNLCTILTPHLRKVGRSNWGQFCIAAATLDTQDGDLVNMVRLTLKELRGTLNAAGWNKICRELGPQLSTLLRKRYKLY